MKNNIKNSLLAVVVGASLLSPAMARDMKARYEAPLLRIFGVPPRSHT